MKKINQQRTYCSHPEIDCDVCALVKEERDCHNVPIFDFTEFDPNIVYHEVPFPLDTVNNTFYVRDLFKPFMDPFPHLHGSCEWDLKKIAKLTDHDRFEITQMIDYYLSIPPEE